MEQYRSSTNRSCVNRVDPYYSRSDPKPILTYPISCKRSPKLVLHYNLLNTSVLGKNELSYKNIKTEVLREEKCTCGLVSI